MSGARQRRNHSTAPTSPSLPFYPAFVRRISDAKDWRNAQARGDAKAAGKVLVERGIPVSFWLANDEIDLQRVTIAINATRVSIKERIRLLAVRRDEFVSAGVAVRRTPDAGLTACDAARALHHDVALDDASATTLAEALIEKGRDLTNCTQAWMKANALRAESEGCFAVVKASTECDCGARRDPQA